MTRSVSKLLNITKHRHHFRQLSNAAAAATRSSNLKDDPKLWVKSPFPDQPTVVGVEMHEIMFERISRWPHLHAMECGVTGKKLTYGDIYQQAKSFGAALIKAGYKRGETIGVVLPNVPEFPIIQLGIWSAGLTMSCVNPAYTEYEIQRQLKSSDAVCAITIEHFVNAVRSAKASNPNLKDIIVIADDALEGCHSFSEMTKCDYKGVEFSSGSKYNTLEDIAILPYSSGTTGPPKGVLLTHTNIATNLMQFLQDDVCATQSVDDTGEQERFIGILPFFHSYGSSILNVGMYQGASTICLPKFDQNTFLETVQKHKPTTMHLVTPLISHIINTPEFTRSCFESLHCVVGAAAPIGQVLINKLLDRAGKYIFFSEGYGMTELSPLTHLLNPSTKNTKIGSCGLNIPSTWSKILDTETGETLGPNNRGELVIKGPQVMKGYYKNDEATANTIDADGWLHTGDIAYYDEDGFFYIVDRLKELIKVKGFQVAPSELEDILREHDQVDDVAVIGVPNEESGEVPRAYIVPKSKNLTEKEINDYLKPIVASFKQLRGGIEFRESIPKAPSGKILRRELVEDYRKRFN